MSNFAKTIKHNLTPTQQARYDAAFVPTPPTQSTPASPQQSAPADAMLVHDMMFPYSRDSDYAAVSEGLSYLAEVNRAGAGTGGSRFGDSAEPADLQAMSKEDGIRFVKTALGLNITDQVSDDAVRAQADQFAAQVFTDMQSQAFSPAAYIDTGRSISQSLHSSVMSTTFNTATGGVASSVSQYNQGRLSQLSQIFGDRGRMSTPHRLRDIGRLPEMKLRFLFYCDMVMWDGTVHRLMTVKSMSGAQITFTQDEVNFYGVRTMVNKAGRYSNATVVLHDDAENSTSSMFYSLVSKSTGGFGSGVESRQRELIDMAASNSDGMLGGAPSPSMRPLLDRNGLIKTLKTTQVYMQDSKVVRDIHTYINPKIVSMVKSDFEMENGTEAHTLTIEFAFDALNVDVGQSEDANWRRQRDSEWSSGRGIFR